jgi:Leucine-rich repeat (LRR) protein
MVRLWSASIATFLVSASSVRAQMSGEEGRLIRFFEVTNGPLWHNNSNWNTTAPICTWFGVGCAPGRTADNVTSLVLESNNLAGRIAKLIYEMPHLQVLNLKDNQLTDAGFDGFGAAEVTAPLTTLQLASNALTKVDGIGNAPKTLTELHFSENHIKGPFPMELFQLTNLRHLLLSFNTMTGTLPTDIGKLSLLQDFYLFGNLFTGQIPSEIGLLTNVEVFTLAENAFHGTIPREVSNMAALQTFSIHNNEDGDGLITGPLRPFDNCPFLDELYLDGNALTGTIPSNFLKRVNDTHATMAVGLSGNKLNGTLPTALTRFTSMTLDVTDNQIQGLPDSLCEKRAWMSGLVESFKCDAILCPPGTYNEDGRQTSTGMSCKDCPAGVAGSRFFGSKHCSLVGEVLPEWHIVAKFYVDLRGTEWDDKTGWEVLDALLQTTKLEDLDGSALIFCGWFGITCNAQKQVEEINLSNNGLTGQIPKETFYLPALKILDVSRCAVTMDGAIGFQFLARAIHLESLNMAGSSITSLAGIGSGTSLKRLVLDSIQLNNATFPFDLCQLTNLEFLQMEFTYVEGGLPSQIGNLRKLST